MAVPVFEVGPVDQTIVYAFAAGFVIAWIIFGIRILVLKSNSKREIRELRMSLANRIDIETSSIDRMKREIEDLKKKNNNLKISVNNLSGRPGRREKLQLQVYQSAIEKMSVRAPGFAPAWHIVLKECEDEAGRSLDGTIPFVQRNIPAVGTGWAGTSEVRAETVSAAEIVSDSELSGKSTIAGRRRRPSFMSRLLGRKNRG